jgi:hypothetical protein
MMSASKEPTWPTFVTPCAGVLYGVSAHDRFSFAAAATIAAVALASCMAPAVRAMRIDPLTELRR